MTGGGEEGTTLEYTPTWVVAAVCTVIVAISLGLERLLHYTGKYLKRKDQKPLFEALQKVKEELMLLGFISLLLTVFQNPISKMCVPADLVEHMLPCSLSEAPDEGETASNATTSHFQLSFSMAPGRIRRLLAETSTVSSEAGTCAAKNKVPLLSTEALHHLHIFIFILAIVHVTFCALTILFGGMRIRQWKHWEDSIAKDNYNSTQAINRVTHVHQHDFIREHFLGIGRNSALLGWLHSFFKQFGAVTKADYTTLRLGFITMHCKSNPKFNFHKYMIRALEDDFKRVVGISWYLWIFVVVFLLLNVNGWHTYFWIAFLPFILLLAVGTKLEHVIRQLAHEVAEKHSAVEGDLVVQPSDEHFWFQRPRIVLYLIHFILFQNAFEIAFFFWILVLCSYSTLPLYAIVTQMGSTFKKAIFDDHLQVGLVNWAQKAKNKKGLRAAAGDGSGSGQASSHDGSTIRVQLGRVFRKASAPGETQPTSGPEGSK